MSSITTWTRLEPLPRSADFTSGLRAEIADPLWLLARQRQFGELRGEDAGSPVQAQLTIQSARISRYHPGEPGANAAEVASDYTDSSFPLETLVEREPVWSSSGAGRLKVEAGLHFLRLLRKHRAGNLEVTYVTNYAITENDLVGDDADTSALRRGAVGRAPDGSRLFGDLRRARGNRRELTELPESPAVPAADQEKVIAAANEFLVWREQFVVEPPRGVDAWKPSRIEHTFAVQALMPSGRVVLVADAYRGGRLEWFHFRAETRSNLGEPRPAGAPERVVRTVIPTPVSYGGMPADRLWEIEDGSVRFGGLITGRTDLARLLLSEFALTYGNDWFIVPIDLPVGSICDITSLRVVDTFAEETLVGPAREQGTSSWTMFTLSAPDAPQRVQNLLFLPPVLVETQESDPLEEVAFFRDEMANIVWGVERVVQSEAGTTLDRYEEHQRSLGAGASQRVLPDFGDAELIYRLQSYVPDHWHPFVPVRAAGLQLERRPIIRVAPDGSRTVVEPKGRILRAASPLRIEEEEVPRSGAIVTRRFQLTRWTDGRPVLWSGRSKRVGPKGGIASGLTYDSVESAANLSSARSLAAPGSR
jgi:hypothetical protein